MGGIFINWYFVTIFYFFTFVILWYLVTFLLGYFEFPFWSPFWQTFKIPYSWFVYVPPNSYSIWFSVSVWSFPTSNNHILHIFLLHLEILSFVYIFCQQDCHKHIWNTSQWNYSKLLSIVWSSALYWEVLHFWYFSCIALPYCSEQHSCHCQIMSQMLFDRGSILAIKPIVLSSDSLCFERFQVLWYSASDIAHSITRMALLGYDILGFVSCHNFG